jgi:hypothetical protein
MKQYVLTFPLNMLFFTWFHALLILKAVVPASKTRDDRAIESILLVIAFEFFVR